MTQPIALSMLGRAYDLVPASLHPIQFRLVQSLDEFTAAAHLAYREYVIRNYVAPTSSQLRLSVYHALPKTRTFIAWHRRAGVIGTITLIEDSPLGLPMDDAYKPELDVMRRKGVRIAEATTLALDGHLFHKGVFSMAHTKKLLLLMRLFKVMLDYVRSSTTVDELVGCFHPKHQLLFEFLNMRPLGEVKAYPGANGTPAVARHLNIGDTQRQCTAHPAYGFFYGKAPSSRSFAKKLALSPDDLRRMFVLDSSIFASASPTELAYLMSCYPTYNFGAIVEGTLSSSGTSVQVPPISRPAR